MSMTFDINAYLPVLITSLPTGTELSPFSDKYVRLGLDGAPKAMVCKCKTANSMLISMAATLDMAGMHKTQNYVSKVSRNNPLPLDPVDVNTMPKIYTIEIESGFMGNYLTSEIEEIGCYKYWREPYNKIVKVRHRTTKGYAVKVPMSKANFMPGMVLTVSYEYSFVGRVVKNLCRTFMTQMSSRMEIKGVCVVVNYRKYEMEGHASFSCEVEFPEKYGFKELTRVMSEFVYVVGWETMMSETTMSETIMSETTISSYIDEAFMAEVKMSEHSVVDISSAENCSGKFMYKADGMKMYVFRYECGYVVCFSDRKLLAMSYIIENNSVFTVDINKTPDVVIVEMISATAMPDAVIRDNWDTLSEFKLLKAPLMQSDGMACVGKHKTVRVKEPTIDVFCKNGAHKDMIEGSLYQMTVKAYTDKKSVRLCNPLRRLAKFNPNTPKIAMRSFASSLGKGENTTILYEVVSVSFKMREMVYNVAMVSASSGRKMTMTVGPGRSQEANLMEFKKFSYIAVDPEVDITRLTKRKNVKSVAKYNKYSTLTKQLKAISSSPGHVLYYDKTFKNFLLIYDTLKNLSEMSTPVVFSSSLSYCITSVNNLMSMSVPVYGCGFVHDGMTNTVAGRRPITMTVKKSRNGDEYVSAVFGKSTYNEPLFMFSNIAGLKYIESVMPWLSKEIDIATKDIMSRAVLLI
ncbi:uncharacterized protein FMAN_15458 [Fusarium mangiferae]|uniref:Uncharacterized protein n=1 Tax=Fusarium mangiferae TaxID=192010 RepID=A0A1L7UEY7_FUSMA|nr:uncharacterized protein FMAN_15458 [Fusarium mangiferae]CVL09218.1 uncharacterized protein FMAN_15458 [Fusarium mangiferae]